MDKVTFAIIQEFKQAVTNLYGDKLKKLVCYGSQAREEASADSDIDLALVLEGEIQPSHEIDQLLHILADFNLRYGVLISLLPIAQETWQSAKGPFWRNLKREGVEL
jgi:predicted nucleotidyltransferase